MENLKQPKISVKDIQESANKAAEKAYLDAIDKYYNGYNSPYKQLIEQELEKQKFNYNLELPSVMSKINKALSDEVDAIANRAISTSFINSLNNALTGFKKDIKLSVILQEIITELDLEYTDFDRDDYRFSVLERGEEHGWLTCLISTPDNEYEFILHTVESTWRESELKPLNKYTYKLLTFPGDSYVRGAKQTMTIYKDDIKIEMPFKPNILQDAILSVLFKVMLGGCHITLDIDDFDDEMFPNNDECHC